MMLMALGIDAVLGFSDWIYHRIGHPVTWLGRVIGALEKRLNQSRQSALRRQASGVVCVVITCLCAALPAALAQSLLPHGWLGIVIGGILAWPLVAARSLYDHVAAVAKPLLRGDLDGAKRTVAMIVGRDPASLDQAGVTRAALESLAENTSDGVVAPLFWGIIAGLPGIAVYKAINTMDSMIGHRNARYDDFGKVAARLDDLVNLIPARLTGVFFALVSGRFGTSMRIMFQDAGRHRSPNAGWPEAAMAGALDLRLSGPRIYGDHIAQEPWLNDHAPRSKPGLFACRACALPAGDVVDGGNHGLNGNNRKIRCAIMGVIWTGPWPNMAKVAGSTFPPGSIRCSGPSLICRTGHGPRCRHARIWPI